MHLGKVSTGQGWRRLLLVHRVNFEALTVLLATAAASRSAILLACLLHHPGEGESVNVRGYGIVHTWEFSPHP